MKLHPFNDEGFEAMRHDIAATEARLDALQQQVQAKRTARGDQAAPDWYRHPDWLRHATDEQFDLSDYLTDQVRAVNDEFSFAAFVDYQLYSAALATLREQVLLQELAHLEATPVG